MTNQSQYEKYEKEEKSRSQDEKGEEKRYEKEQPEKQQQEKRWDEKRQRDPIGALTWPIVLIWAGLVFLLDNVGVLRNISGIGRIDPWSLILAGAGAIILVMVIIRYLMPEYRRPLTGNIILGFFLLGIGLSDILGWDIIWAIIIIAIGVTLLLRGLGRRR